MKNILIIVLGIFLSFSFVKEESYTLKVEVNGLRNHKGQLLVYLYNEEGSIPDKHFKNYYKHLVIDIKDGATSIVFDKLPKGKYAVNIIHDENKNEKVDKGFIFPKEGIGFSNFKKLNLGNRPNFLRASFYLDTDKTIRIKTIYM